MSSKGVSSSVRTREKRCNSIPLVILPQVQAKSWTNRYCSWYCTANHNERKHIYRTLLPGADRHGNAERPHPANLDRRSSSRTLPSTPIWHTLMRTLLRFGMGRLLRASQPDAAGFFRPGVGSSLGFLSAPARLSPMVH